jgi:hypothetical protein
MGKLPREQKQRILVGICAGHRSNAVTIKGPDISVTQMPGFPDGETIVMRTIARKSKEHGRGNSFVVECCGEKVV